MGFKIKDLVGRKSYGCDILFRIIDMKEKNGKQIAILFGEEYRLIADAPLNDLILIDHRKKIEMTKEYRSLEENSFRLFQQELERLKYEQEYDSTNGYEYSPNYFQLPGKVLHIDGDPNYLEKCLNLYKKIGVPITGIHCDEKEMPYQITPLLEHYRPDILVITGHDSYSKAKGTIEDLNAYRHSKYFVQTVQQARKKIPHLDQLVIFAGACQSHFESLIYAGANFASSPSRVNIHALDPVYVVAKIAFTPFMERINVWDVLRNTLTGEKGLGGVETKGVLRVGMPYKSWQEDTD